MLQRILTPALLLVALLALSASVQAQVTPIANTGCPSANSPVFTGQPRINQSFGFTAGACSSAQGSAYYMLGLAQSFSFPAPPSCDPACILGCLPIITMAGAGVTSTVPNNSALIGAEFCLETACLEEGPQCLNFQQAYNIRIQS